MDLSTTQLRELLKELNDWLELESCDPVEWVVCGGVALLFQGLGSRTTRDVDVLGDWNPSAVEIVHTKEFPNCVKTCIKRVVDNHPELAGFGIHWVNLGSSGLVAAGLPKGFEERLTREQFGEKLTLHFLCREDLLQLKLYAAIDERGSRQAVHIKDLRTLHPTRDELESGIGWLKSLKGFDEFKKVDLRLLLKELGHDDLAYYI